MTSLESKLLDGKNAGYCSSSDEEVKEWQIAKDEDQHQTSVMRQLGSSVRTGPKGVLNEYALHQEQIKRTKEKKDREILKMARQGMLQGSACEHCSTEEESLEDLRHRRLAELRKAASGKMVEILDKDQFTSIIDTCNSLLCVLIYEPDDEMCQKLTHVCKILAADYPHVRFVRARSSLLGMSKAFTEKALPTLQFYSNGNLSGNFVKLQSLLDGEVDVDRLKKLLRRQHISLAHGGYVSDSESTDDELD